MSEWQQQEEEDRQDVISTPILGTVDKASRRTIVPLRYLADSTQAKGRWTSSYSWDRRNAAWLLAHLAGHGEGPIDVEEAENPALPGLLLLSGRHGVIFRLCRACVFPADSTDCHRLLLTTCTCTADKDAMRGLTQGVNPETVRTVETATFEVSRYLFGESTNART